MTSRFVADLASITDLSLEGALVIAAEFDRIRRVRGFRPNLEDEDWEPWLRSALKQLGLYRLVNASNRNTDDVPYDFGLKFVPFITGHQVESERANELLEALKSAAGDQPDYHPLYDGLVEAISNVRDHAYEEQPRRGGLYPYFPQWWAAGAFDPQDRRLELSVYDQGLGIPQTIKSKTRFAPLFASLSDGGTDAERIALALEYGRSSASDQGRGNGLWRMAKLVDSCPGSTVQILSGNGRVTYGGIGDCKKDILQSKFCGTLIHWDLAMPSLSRTR